MSAEKEKYIPRRGDLIRERDPLLEGVGLIAGWQSDSVVYVFQLWPKRGMVGRYFGELELLASRDEIGNPDLIPREIRGVKIRESVPLERLR